MQSINECYDFVKKDCVKYLKSQETKKDKFKNKDKMIKSFLVPISFWLSRKVIKNKTLIIGIAGGQGTGKTTISSIISLILKKYFKLNVFKISIDDFYKTRAERYLLSKKIHHLLINRGAPGTHDIKFILNFFRKIKNKKFNKIEIPKFDKSIDNRLGEKFWYKIKKRPDILILEGWCVGAKPQKKIVLNKPVNSLEKFSDKNLIWRNYVNYQLKTSYRKVFKQLNYLIYLKAKNFKLIQNWRIKQERKLLTFSKKNKCLKIMKKDEVINFMKTYQRITQNMFKDAPKYASIILNLNSNHQIKSVFYKIK